MYEYDGNVICLSCLMAWKYLLKIMVIGFACCDNIWIVAITFFLLQLTFKKISIAMTNELLQLSWLMVRSSDVCLIVLLLHYASLSTKQ